MSRVMFMSPPEIGKTYPIGERPYTVLRYEDYTRKRDGEPAVLVVWECACTDCDKRMEFKTGRTMGDIQTKCLACYKLATDAKADLARRDRTAEKTVPVETIWQAVTNFVAAHGRRPMSLARNASYKKLYAPALLRDDQPKLLASYTLEEIRTGIEQALESYFIGWGRAGTYGSGHERKGLYAQSRKFLELHGLVEPSVTVFA